MSGAVGQINGFVQTDRATHEAWGRLTIEHKTAAALLHMLVSQVGDGNSVTASFKTLAAWTGLSVITVRRSIEVLRDQNWIDVVQVGGAGTMNSYILNSRVAWHTRRDGLQYAKFSSTIIANGADQSDRESLSHRAQLRRIPTMQAGEVQLPSGDGLPPVSQPSLLGLEPELPAMRESAPPAPSRGGRLINNE